MKWCLILIFAHLLVPISSKLPESIHKFKSNTSTKFICKRTKCKEKEIICSRLKHKTYNVSSDTLVTFLKLCDVRFMKCRGYQVEILPLKNCLRHRKSIWHAEKTRVKRDLTSETEEVQESPESVFLSMPLPPSDNENMKDKVNKNDINTSFKSNKNLDSISSHEKKEKESTTEDKDELNTDKHDDENQDDGGQLTENENNILNSKDTTLNTKSDNGNEDIDLEDAKSDVINDVKDAEPKSKENEILTSENEPAKGGEANNDDNTESNHINTDDVDHEDDKGENNDLQTDINVDVENIPNNSDESKNNSDEEQEQKTLVDNIKFPVDYDLQEANEGVDFDEYHKNCPTVCPAREVMVCARCNDGVYRTFMSVCHLRMFNCKHPDEKAELVSRYPCVLSAPYLAEAPAPKGRVSEPGDKDVIVQYIRCRESEKLGDPKCKFSSKRENTVNEK